VDLVFSHQATHHRQALLAAQIRSGQESSGFTLWAAAALIVLLFLLFLAVLSLSITRDWRDTRARASESALAASQVVATNARWIAELSRQALSRMDEALGPNIEANVDSTAELIEDAIATLPGSARAYVLAANGDVLFSTGDPNGKIDVFDREYFSALANGQFWYFSSLLVSRQTGSQVFVVSKRLTRNGAFAGAAIISFDVMVLKETWESLGLDEVSTVSLVRSDGQLVARYPLADGPLDLSKRTLFTEHLPRGDSGTYDSAVSPVDGESRTVGYRRVSGTPYVALASVSTQSAYELFWRNTSVMLAFALPTALALAVAIVWIIRLLMRDRQRRDQLSEALHLNRLLVKDTHHRVKNNLQAVMSMVRMHDLPGELKSDLQSRIAAMSIVHESLYRLDQFAEVDAATLIPRVVEPLREAFAAPVRVHYDVEPLVIDRDAATPLALIVSEVVTNALKYAFPDGRKGTIRIGFTQNPGGQPVLTIADDGIGFDEAKTSRGMGTRLIKAMVMQLGGTQRYVRDAGTRFEATLAVRAIYRPQQPPPPEPSMVEQPV
jgi:two-component sensor histidine kinase